MSSIKVHESPLGSFCFQFSSIFPLFLFRTIPISTAMKKYSVCLFVRFANYISEFDNALEQILSLRRPQPTVFCGYVASPVSLLRKSCSIIVTYNKFYADLLALPCCSIRGRRLCLHTLVVSHVGLCCICFLLFVLGFFWKLSGLHFGSKAWVGLFWWQCSDSSALVLSTPCPGSAFPTSSPSSLV